jgi:hypothetical protein
LRDVIPEKQARRLEGTWLDQRQHPWIRGAFSGVCIAIPVGISLGDSMGPLDAAAISFGCAVVSAVGLALFAKRFWAKRT